VIGADSVEPVSEDSGAELLSEVHGTLKEYVAFSSEHQAVAITLWISATHALPAWDHATRLAITSPQKRCGKSRLLDVMAALSCSPLLASNATVPAIFRSIGQDDSAAPTLFIDEADALFGTKRAAEQNEDLRALINAGWQRERPVIRCVGPGYFPVQFNTFAMVAIAAIGQLPDTISDRAINIRLKRRGRLEDVSPFRWRRDGLRLNGQRDRLAAWVRHPELIKVLADAEPSMPVEDRAADAWEPLIAIADAAGGDWPTKARAACRALVDAAESADEEQLTSLRLLSDIRWVFAESGKPFLPSVNLVLALRTIEDSPWDDFSLSASKLAFRLKDYGVKPGRDPSGTFRGYRLADFADVFDRYLRDEKPSSGGRSDTISGGPEASDVPGSPDGSRRQESSSDDPGRQFSSDVSVEKRSYVAETDALTNVGGHYPDVEGQELKEVPIEIARYPGDRQSSNYTLHSGEG
jgi:hypothetical protein